MRKGRLNKDISFIIKEYLGSFKYHCIEGMKLLSIIGAVREHFCFYIHTTVSTADLKYILYFYLFSECLQGSPGRISGAPFKMMITGDSPHCWNSSETCSEILLLTFQDDNN